MFHIFLNFRKIRKNLQNWENSMKTRFFRIFRPEGEKCEKIVFSLERVLDFRRFFAIFRGRKQGKIGKFRPNFACFRPCPKQGKNAQNRQFSFCHSHPLRAMGKVAKKCSVLGWDRTKCRFPGFGPEPGKSPFFPDFTLFWHPARTSNFDRFFDHFFTGKQRKIDGNRGPSPMKTRFFHIFPPPGEKCEKTEFSSKFTILQIFQEFCENSEKCEKLFQH